METFKPVQSTAPPPPSTAPVINLDEDEDYMSLPLAERINRMLSAKQSTTTQPKDPDEVFNRPIKADESVSANIFGAVNKKTVPRKKPKETKKLKPVEKQPKESVQKSAPKKQPTVQHSSTNFHCQ